jgi:hypothetical protein
MKSNAISIKENRAWNCMATGPSIDAVKQSAMMVIAASGSLPLYRKAIARILEFKF